ncbi:MAG: D-glycero-alpha-D-manno-heptose-1,7-bisphosphate 7-phosphatase [Gemmatimonadaceae bacterium]
MRAGAFLDRDGTINVDTHHVSRVEDVHLIAGAAAAIAALNAAGVPVVIVTNQGGIARGYFTEDDYARVRDRVLQLLAAEGARVDAVYHCPHYPSVTGPCDCRKPGLRNYERGAAALVLDLAQSLFVGDRITDVLPAAAVGGTGVLVPSAHTATEDVARAGREHLVAPTLGDAVRGFLSGRRDPGGIHPMAPTRRHP